MIKVLKTGINVKKVVDQLKKYPGDWGPPEESGRVSVSC